MPLSTILKRPVAQIAYFVTDAEAAARRHASLFGSGPYYLAKNIPLESCLHRGKPAELDHTSAYGQFGAVMIEFVQQNNEGPSVFRDLYAPGEEGIHHIALIVPDLHAELTRFADAGFETALFAKVASAGYFAMADATKSYGHFIEMYEPSEGLVNLYKMIKDAHENYEGGDVIRHLAIGRP